MITFGACPQHPRRVCQKQLIRKGFELRERIGPLIRGLLQLPGGEVAAGNLKPGRLFGTYENGWKACAGQDYPLAFISRVILTGWPHCTTPSTPFNRPYFPRDGIISEFEFPITRADMFVVGRLRQPHNPWWHTAPPGRIIR